MEAARSREFTIDDEQALVVVTVEVTPVAKLEPSEVKQITDGVVNAMALGLLNKGVPYIHVDVMNLKVS
jgi:hypothetical protein